MVKVSYTPPPKQQKKGSKFKKIAKSRAFWLSVVLVVAGAVIVAASFHVQGSTSYSRTSSKQNFAVSDAVANTYKFTLKANTSAQMTFIMPLNDTVHYYVSKQAGTYGLPHSIFGGDVVNGSVVNISTYVNMSAITNDTFYILTINSYAPQSFNLTVTLEQEKPVPTSANNNLLEAGALVAIAGIALAWVSASRALKR